MYIYVYMYIYIYTYIYIYIYILFTYIYRINPNHNPISLLYNLKSPPLSSVSCSPTLVCSNIVFILLGLALALTPRGGSRRDETPPPY